MTIIKDYFFKPLSKWDYICQHVYIGVYITLIFNVLLSLIGIRSFTYKTGAGLVLSEYFLCALSSLIFIYFTLFRKRSRTRFMITFDVLCGLSVFSIRGFGEYINSTAKRGSYICVILCLAVVLYFSIKNIIHNNDSKTVKSIIVDIVCVNRFILGIVSLILVSGLFFTGFGTKTGNELIKYEEPDSELFYGDEYSLENNLDLIMPLFSSEESWNSMDINSKEDAIRALIYAQAHEYGITHKILVLTSDELNERTNAAYNSGSHIIFLNEEFLKNKYSDPRAWAKTALHEVYHVYQHDLIDVYLNSTAKQRALMCFNDENVNVKRWIDELKDYKTGEVSDDIDGYLEYYNQSIEQTARKESEDLLPVYEKRINELLRENL